MLTDVPKITTSDADSSQVKVVLGDKGSEVERKSQMAREREELGRGRNVVAWGAVGRG